MLLLLPSHVHQAAYLNGPSTPVLGPATDIAWAAAVQHAGGALARLLLCCTLHGIRWHWCRPALDSMLLTVSDAKCSGSLSRCTMHC